MPRGSIRGSVVVTPPRPPLAPGAAAPKASPPDAPENAAPAEDLDAAAALAAVAEKAFAASDPIGKCTGMTTELAAHVVSSYECAVQAMRYAGHGRVDYKNDNKYQGDFYRGQLHGHGKLKWKDGVKYEGAFVHSTINGTGVYEWPDGGRYCGEITGGCRHGYGVYVRPGVRYQGSWRSGLKDGLGVLLYDNGGFFSGEFIDGKKHGWGRMVYSSGSRYEGEWDSDRRHGYGVMEWVIRRQEEPAPAPAASSRPQTAGHSSAEASTQAGSRPATAGTAHAARTAPPLRPRQVDSRPTSADPTHLDPPQGGPQTTPLGTPRDSGAAAAVVSQPPQTARVERYDGPWVDGKPDGIGTYSWLCKAVPAQQQAGSASSNFSVGASLGGVETPLQGENVFKGRFTAGVRDGPGVLYLADGTVMEGEWSRGLKVGRAVVRHCDGCVELLEMREDVIAAKRVLVPGHSDKRAAGDIARQSLAAHKAALTLTDSQMSDAVVPDVADLLTLDGQPGSMQRVTDLLTRSMPMLKFLYRFYARMAPLYEGATPASRRREEERRERWERLVERKASAAGAQLHHKHLAADLMAAERAAMARAAKRCSLPDLSECAAGPPSAMTPRDALMARLHHAVCTASARATAASAQAATEEHRAPISPSAPDEVDRPSTAPYRNGRPPTAGTGASMTEATPGPAGSEAPTIPPILGSLPPVAPRPLPMPPAPAEEPSTLVRLEHLWELLAASGICAADFPLWRVDELIAGVVRKQAYCLADEQGLLSDDSDSGAECESFGPDPPTPKETKPAPREERKGRGPHRGRSPRVKVPSLPTSPVGTPPQPQMVEAEPAPPPAAARRNTTTSRKSSTAPPAEEAPPEVEIPKAPPKTPRLMRKGMVSRGQRQQRGDPHDGCAPILFPAFVESLVRVAHFKVAFTSGYVYHNACSDLSLCERTLWVMTYHIAPLAEALRVASQTTLAAPLGLPSFPPDTAANQTYMTRDEKMPVRRKKPRGLGGTEGMPSGRSEAAAAGGPKGTPSQRGGAGDTPQDAHATTFGAGADTPQTGPLAVAKEGSNQWGETTAGMTFGQTMFGSMTFAQTRKGEPDPEPIINSCDRTERCAGEFGAMATLTATTVTYRPPRPKNVPALVASMTSLQPPAAKHFTIYTETVHDDPTRRGWRRGGGGGSTLLGLVSADGNVREASWQRRDQAVWNAYSEAKDAVEEYQEQRRRQRLKQLEAMQSPTTDVFSESPRTEADSMEEPLVSEERHAEALRQVKQQPPPLCWRPSVHPTVLLRSRPVHEAVQEGGEVFASLFEQYGDSGRGRILLREVVRILRDHSVIGQAPPKARRGPRAASRSPTATSDPASPTTPGGGKPAPKRSTSISKDGLAKRGSKGAAALLAAQQQEKREREREEGQRATAVLLAERAKEREAEAAARAATAPPLCTHSMRDVLRYPLWYVLGVDVDEWATPCHVYTDPRFENVPPEAQKEEDCGATTSEPAEDWAASRRSSPRGSVAASTRGPGATQGMLALSAPAGSIRLGSMRSLRSADRTVDLARSELHRKLAERDQIVAKPEWIPAQPSVTDEIARYDWEYVVADVPLLFHEFVAVLSLTAMLVFTKYPEPHRAASCRKALNGTPDAGAAEKIALLLRHLGGGPAAMNSRCVPLLPVQLQAPLPVRRLPKEAEDDKDKKRRK